MNTDTDLELVRRARGGAVPAFETLYRRYSDRIYNFAKQVTGSADDASDVLQETFVRAWHALTDLRSDATFGVWLHRIALNLSRDCLKKRGREPAASLDAQSTDDDGGQVELQVESDVPGPEEALVTGEVHAAVRRAVESLSADHRLVVMMHHMEGMDVESVARILGISKGTVMSRLSRAREALRRKLAPYVEGK